MAFPLTMQLTQPRGVLSLSRTEMQWPHSCRQGDLKRSSRSAGKKKRAALDISGWGRQERGALLMGRKSKPIMHLIILLCGLFMHLISSHPYSSPAAALTHVDQLGSGETERKVFGKNIIIHIYRERDRDRESYSKKVNQAKYVKFQPIMPGNLNA